jgi:tetratricopeptide (TPR) repeat protein
MMISECYAKMEAYEPAISNLHYLLDLTKDPETMNDIFFQIGWICFEKGDIENARNYFKKIDDKNKAKYHSADVITALDAVSLIPRKNPTLAGIFSVIPGGGYLYCGRYYDAVTAFLVNGLLIYAAYESFDKEMSALGGLISLVEIGFYTGNIYGSISAAHKYNKRQHLRFTEQVKKHIGVSPLYSNGLIGFSFYFDF